MTAAAQRAFSGGIIAPGMYSRSDIPKFQSGLKDGVNVVLRAQGGVANRAGTELAGGYDNSTPDGHPWLVPFEFSSDDSYQLEFADNVMRVIKDGAYVLDFPPPRTIVSMTSTNPAQFELESTAIADTFSEGRLFFINDPAGDSPFHRTVAETLGVSGEFVSFRLSSTVVNGATTGWQGVSPAGTIQRIFELETPYAIEDLPNLYVVQDVDTLFIACPGYDVRALQRGTSDNQWTLSVLDFEPSVAPPEDPDVQAFDGGASTSTDYTYVVVSQETTPTQEDPPITTNLEVSNQLTVSADFGQDATEVTLSWVFAEEGGFFSDHDQFTIGRTTDPSDDLFDIMGTVSGAARKFVDDGSGAPFAPLSLDALDLTSPPVQPADFELRAEVRQPEKQQYVVTALLGGEESLPSAAAYAENDLTLDGRKNRVSWSEVEGAEFYNVYKSFNGIYGFIGVTTSLSFDDDNITPDTADNPPTGRDPFAGSDNQPSVVTFVENRLTFANTPANPQLVEMSNSVSPFNFNRALTPAGSDAVTFRMRSQKLNRVEHIVALEKPVILTAGAEWVLETRDDAPIQPANFSLKPRTYRGSSGVKPVIIGSTIVHAMRDGNTLREFSLREARQQVSADLTVLARSLFRGKTIVSMAYAQSPDSVVWVVFSDGSCLSMTYLEEHEVWGWTRHEFGGADAKVKQVSVIREGAHDTPYFVVDRTGRVFVERLDPRAFTRVEDAFFVDSGLKFTGDNLTEVSGMIHLRERDVSVLADGNVIEGLTVDGFGRLEIPGGADTVIVGYPYTSSITTLPVDFGDSIQNKGSAIGDYRAASEVAMQVVDTRGIAVGREGGWLNEIKQFTGDDPIPLETGTIVLPIEGDWERDASLVVEQVYPLPMEITSIVPEWALAD